MKLTTAAQFAAETLREDNELRLLHLQDAVITLFADKSERPTALLMLRDIVNATCGFEVLSEKTGIPSKSIMRMLSTEGNPKFSNLMSIVSFLIKQEGGHPEFKIAV